MEMAFMAKGGSFPDLTGDGKVTKKDILRGRGVEGFGEGGLKDEGGTKDKESGNDVPSGSLKKEVRDDIPAMVSEGEFILPADVVRYHGLEKLMGLRQEAKAGLKVMEEMGQMGNSDEATIPDDLPFSLSDIMIVEEKAEGGVIHAQEGTDVPSYEDFMGGGSNKYDSKLVAYKDKDGKIKYIREDYMNRPMQDTTGLERVEQLRPDDESDSQEDTKPEEESTEDTELQRRREEKRKERRQEQKAILREEQAAQAMKTSAERLGIPLEEYKELPLSARLGLIGQEMRIMAGGKLDTAARDKVLEDAKKAGDGFFAGIGNRIKNFFGIGDDEDTPKAPTVTTEAEGKGAPPPTIEEGTSDAEEFAAMTQGTVPYTDAIQREALRTDPATVQPVTALPSNMFEGQDPTEVGKSLANLSESNLNTVIDEARRQQGQISPRTTVPYNPRLGVSSEGIRERSRFLEKAASDKKIRQPSSTVTKEQVDASRQRRQNKKDAFKTAADKKTTKIIAKRGRRDQGRVDKEEKKIKDRLTEASKTGTLRLKKGGLMKKDYP